MEDQRTSLALPLCCLPWARATVVLCCSLEVLHVDHIYVDEYYQDPVIRYQWPTAEIYPLSEGLTMDKLLDLKLFHTNTLQPEPEPMLGKLHLCP